ncbi:MAG: hypothetical protein JWN86_2608 [Planctomycetota bacterium]|nr:hypothetical protein [Planctomycetota bacterium]
MDRCVRLAVIPALILLCNAESKADVIRYRYAGVITSFTPSGTVDALNVAPGTRFSGTIAYDPLNPGERTSTQHQLVGFRVDGDPVSNPTPFTFRLDGVNSPDAGASGSLDLYVIQQTMTPPNPGEPLIPTTTLTFATDQDGRHVLLHLWSKGRWLTEGGEQPLSPPQTFSLSDFTRTEVSFFNSSGSFTGEVQSLTMESGGDPVPIPEPSSWLVMVGVMAVVTRRARRPS